jgi:hypothetical protein
MPMNGRHATKSRTLNATYSLKVDVAPFQTGKTCARTRAGLLVPYLLKTAGGRRVNGRPGLIRYHLTFL